jgi:hypothetical protein
MNKKLVSLGILLLLGLMLSGCVWVGGYDYNHGYPHGYNGYSYRYHHGDLDDHHFWR